MANELYFKSFSVSYLPKIKNIKMQCLTSHGRLCRLAHRHPCIQRQVSSLTSLGTAFNSNPQKLSFFPSKWLGKAKTAQTGLFQFPELDTPSGFELLKSKCAARSQELVDEACSHPPSRTRIVARIFDELSDELCRVADMAEFVRLAHPDRAMAEAAQKACIDVSGLVERLNTNVQFYQSLQNSVNEESRNAEFVDQHVGKLFLLDFHLCGIHLGDKHRQSVVELNDAILQIGQQFVANCNQPRIIREFDSVQEELLTELVSLRHQLAQKCGYETFGHRAMTEHLAGSPSKVSAFLNKLSAELKPRVAKDYYQMLQMKRKLSSSTSDSLNVEDVPYILMQARNHSEISNISEYEFWKKYSSISQKQNL